MATAAASGGGAPKRSGASRRGTGRTPVAGPPAAAGSGLFGDAAGIVPEGGRTGGDVIVGAPAGGALPAAAGAAFCAPAVVDDGVLLGVVALTGGRAADIALVDGDLIGVDVAEGRDAGTLTAAFLSSDVETTLLGGRLVVSGIDRVEAGARDPCGCTGGPLIDGGGTESSA